MFIVSMDCKILLVFCVIAQTIEAIQLGKPFSILHGIKPVFPEASSLNNVFYSVNNTDLFSNVNQNEVQDHFHYFGPDIKLTYHHDRYDLLKEFFSMWNFAEETRDAAAYIFTGQDSEDTETALATLFGISPENMANKVYVLARYWKELSTTTMTSGDFTTLTSSAVLANATSNNITGLFSEYGTHYVSGYVMGDMIYQVFVYDKNVSSDIQVYPFQDPNARASVFRQFTQPTSVGVHGYCREAGTIKSASRDPALESIIPELEDDIYQVSHSILMFLTSREKYELADTLERTIPIKLFFKPIVKKLMPKSSLSKLNWNKILAATIFQKFGQESLPNFPTIVDNRTADVYDSFNPDLITSTATNYVSITRMTFDLENLFLLNPQSVTHLFIFADVLRISGTSELPGSQKIFLICREFIAMSSGNNIPEIKVGSHGESEPSVKIVAKLFRGVLKVTQVTQGESLAHFTYHRKNVYKTVDDPNVKNQKTVQTDDSRKLRYPNKATIPELYLSANVESFEETWLTNSFVNSVELIVTATESILSVRSVAKVEDMARRSLEWITNTLIKSSKVSSALSDDLEMVLSRALLVTKTRLTKYAKSRILVPRLTFAHYKPLYDTLLTEVSTYGSALETVTNEINEEKQRETTTKTIAELNKNVRRIGTFLIDQVDVNAQHQRDVFASNEELLRLERDRIARQQIKARLLLDEIITIQEDVKAAGKTLEAAIRRHEKLTFLSVFLNVAQLFGSLFTGGVGLFTIPDKFKGITRMAEKIKSVVQIIEQINKLFQLGINTRDDIRKVNRAMENIPVTDISEDSFPTELEWSDFDGDVASYTSYLPAAVQPEALEFQRLAKRVSARGKKYVTIAGNIATIKYQQIQIEMQRDVSRRHQNRLTALKSTLTQNDISDDTVTTMDLFEIGNIIKMQENQVRSHLVQTLTVMDAALQYHYFQEPTLITRFDTMSIQRAASEQMRSSILALEDFSSLPVDLSHPIEYVIPGVSVEALVSKGGYKVTIPLSSRPFLEYVRVRILRLQVRVDHITTTSAKNTVYIQANSSGDPFRDRDLNRNPRQFSTTRTSFRYTYNIRTGDTHVPVNPTQEFSSTFIKITPFDEWTFHLPKVVTNKGVSFSTKVTTLRIKFYVNAIFHPPHTNRKIDFLHQRTLSDVGVGTTDFLLSRMKGCTLLHNWDAIMAVNAEQVNQIWQQQYDTSRTEFPVEIATGRAVSSEDRSTKTERRLILEVGPPRVQFLENNINKANLTMKIKSATAEFWKTNQESKNVEHVNETLSLDDSTYIIVYVDLLKLQGNLTEESKVVLDLSNGVCDVANLPLLSTELLNVRNEIQIYFNTQLRSLHYELARIRYEKTLTPHGLVPDRFYLATGVSNLQSSLGTLYIFIRTHSSRSIEAGDPLLDFTEPLSIHNSQVIPNGFEVALFIHNRIIFEEHIKSDIEKNFGFGVHTLIPGQEIAYHDAEQSAVHWELYKATMNLNEDFTQTSFEKAINLNFYSLDLENVDNQFLRQNPQNQAMYIAGNFYSAHEINVEVTDGVVSFPIPGRTLTVKSKGNGSEIEVNWVNNNIEVSVPFQDWTCHSGTLGKRSWVMPSCHSYIDRIEEIVTFNINYIQTYTPVIDENQSISYNWNRQTGSGTTCSSSIRQGRKQEAVDEIIRSVESYMSKLVDFDFTSISAFALSQVAFPNQTVFRFREIYVPGDMVILGDVSTNPTKSSKSTSKKSSKFLSKKSTKSIWKNITAPSPPQRNRKKSFLYSRLNLAHKRRPKPSVKGRHIQPGRGLKSPSRKALSG